jgi:signal transduction histidine kinase
MDEGEWSPFSLETSRIFQSLPSGSHIFEVKARDRDLNEDETPAQTVFTVVPPVWQQAWFIGLMLVVVVVVGYQAFKLLSRDRMLRVSNRALSEANNSLFQANTQIRVQNRWKSQFLVSMSHELRTPLNSIIGYTNLLLRQSKDLLPERQHTNLQKVRQGGDYILSLVDDLLDLTGIETGKVEVYPGRCEMRELVAGCCATVGPLIKDGVTLSHSVADDVDEVRTDQTRLRQILVNLLGNAIKSTPEGEIAVRASREGDTVAIAVADSGAGIPEEKLGTVFEEFRQVEGSGMEHRDTGLGLAIAKKLTELLGGSIDVESEEGVGSTFTVRIPAVYREE